jgi:Uma2 family endonuclease
MSTATSPDARYFTSDVEDDVYYPSSDGKPMAETGIHVTAILMLYQALEDFFRGRDDVYFAANMFWYWEKGNPKARRAPDVMVITGVSAGPMRRSFRSWQEGAVPAAIFEITSKKTFQTDLTVKHRLYRDLGVREYFIFDPDNKYVRPALIGFRLRNGGYETIEYDRDGRLTSDLGFLVKAEGQTLRLFEGRTGKPISTRSEAVAAEEQLLGQERRRVEQLQAEVAELRRQLAQSGGPPAP